MLERGFSYNWRTAALLGMCTPARHELAYNHTFQAAVAGLNGEGTAMSVLKREFHRSSAKKSDECCELVFDTASKRL